MPRRRPANRQTESRRLLILGAGHYQVPAIETAKRLGCYVITLDYLPDNPGHKIADAQAIVSTVDMEDVLEIARAYDIDGVLTYGSDVSAPTVAYVAERLGLPGNPFEAGRTLQRKDLFRVLQREHGIPYPAFASAGSGEDASRSVARLNYPLVVKPADSTGSKGQSLIRSAGELASAFEHAKPFSRCGQVVFEEYLASDMLELVGDVLIQHGKLAFRHYGHNWFLKNSPVSVPVGEIMPGLFDARVERQLDEQLQQIIDAAHLRQGVLNFDAILSGGTVYIVDIGLRNGGNFLDDLIQLSTGFDLTEATIFTALGLEYPCERLFVRDAKPVVSYILNAASDGTFVGLDIAPEIGASVVSSRLFVEIGSPVRKYLRGDYGLGMVFLGFPDMETLRRNLDSIEAMIAVRVETPGAAERGRYKRFSELVSPFLRSKLAQARADGDDTVARVLSRQFVGTPEETSVAGHETAKHFEAGASPRFEGVQLQGVERLYRRVIVVEPQLECIAHCRHCARRNYDAVRLNEEDLSRLARFIGTDPINAELREILVTGGDPLLAPDRLGHFLDEVARGAPQIRVVRIGSRLPIQHPDWVSGKVLGVLGRARPFTIEIGTQVNHAAELFPEVVQAYARIHEHVSVIYNQAVLLRGVNDTEQELVDLFDRLREADIEPYYIFHCCPVSGINALRVPLARSLELVNAVSSSGRISGRAKPLFALLTDIGKVTLYEGVIREHRDNRYLLKSCYSYAERVRWNPTWMLPDSARVDPDGMMSVWYEDATP